MTNLDALKSLLATHRLVPVEATDKMLDAAINGLEGGCLATDLYREMLTAAPDASALIQSVIEENERLRSDREYVIGFNDGWEDAIGQRLRFPTMLRKMWSGDEVQRWIDQQMSEARAALATPSPATAPVDDAGLVARIAEYLKDQDEALFTGTDFEATEDERLESASAILALTAALAPMTTNWQALVEQYERERGEARAKVVKVDRDVAAALTAAEARALAAEERLETAVNLAAIYAERAEAAGAQVAALRDSIERAVDQLNTYRGAAVEEVIDRLEYALAPPTKPDQGDAT